MAAKGLRVCGGRGVWPSPKLLLPRTQPCWTTQVTSSDSKMTPPNLLTPGDQVSLRVGLAPICTLIQILAPPVSGYCDLGP